MANPDPPQPPQPCLPDTLLTQQNLEALYKEFRSGLRDKLPEASIFSHLVGGVRQPYTTEITGLLKEIIRRSDQYEQRLSEMKQYYESRPAVTAVAGGRPGGQESAAPPTYGESSSSATWRAGEVLPADPVTIYVGSAGNARRDMLKFDSGDLERNGWVVRFGFKCFRFLEVGTVRITVMQSNKGQHRTNAFLATDAGHEDGWVPLVNIHAFRSWRPNTEMISVGYAENPERCIFIRGDHADKLTGWSEKFVFWVPV